MSNSGLRRSLEKWFHGVGVRPRLVAEIEDPAFVRTLASHGLGFMAIPTLVAKESVTQLRLHSIGKTEECRQQFYAITAERKRSHPAVQAIISKAKPLENR
jgi:LysR family transcriptional activator of nhaA